MARRNHPIFARVFHRFAAFMERDYAQHRRALLAGLEGRVVEIGAGNGMNFRHYPSTVDEVVAVEPDPYLRGKAEAAARNAPVKVTVRDGVGEDLAIEDQRFDAAVASLVLCSVADPPQVLDQVRGVLKQGGELRFLEHVRGQRPAKARAQTLLDRSRLWPLAAGGCHCSRDTVAAIEAAGYDIQHVRSFDVGPSRSHTNPHVLGTATPRRAPPTAPPAAQAPPPAPV